MDSDDTKLVAFLAVVVLVIFGLAGSVIFSQTKQAQIKADAWRDCCTIIVEGINDFARAPIDIMEWQLQRQKELLEEAVQDPRPGPRG